MLLDQRGNFLLSYWFAGNCCCCLTNQRLAIAGRMLCLPKIMLSYLPHVLANIYSYPARQHPCLAGCSELRVHCFSVSYNYVTDAENHLSPHFNRTSSTNKKPTSETRWWLLLTRTSSIDLWSGWISAQRTFHCSASIMFSRADNLALFPPHKVHFGSLGPPVFA